MDITERNSLRADVGLPLLSVDVEARRLEAVREQAAFEKYFQQNRHRFVHLWSDRNRGFWTNVGIWNAVRKKLREEMRKNSV
jgi:hypothetical protein